MIGATASVLPPAIRVQVASLSEITIACLLLLMVKRSDVGLCVLGRVLLLEPHWRVVLALVVRVALAKGVEVAAILLILTVGCAASESVAAILAIL